MLLYYWLVQFYPSCFVCSWCRPFWGTCNLQLGTSAVGYPFPPFSPCGPQILLPASLSGQHLRPLVPPHVYGNSLHMMVKAHTNLSNFPLHVWFTLSTCFEITTARGEVLWQLSEDCAKSPWGESGIMIHQWYSPSLGQGIYVAAHSKHSSVNQSLVKTCQIICTGQPGNGQRCHDMTESSSSGHPQSPYGFHPYGLYPNWKRSQLCFVEPEDLHGMRWTWPFQAVASAVPSVKIAKLKTEWERQNLKMKNHWKTCKFCLKSLVAYSAAISTKRWAVSTRCWNSENATICRWLFSASFKTGEHKCNPWYWSWQEKKSSKQINTTEDLVWGCGRQVWDRRTMAYSPSPWFHQRAPEKKSENSKHFRSEGFCKGPLLIAWRFTCTGYDVFSRTMRIIRLYNRKWLT